MSNSHFKTVQVKIEQGDPSQPPTWTIIPESVEVELPAAVRYELHEDSEGWSLYNLANISLAGDLKHVIGKTCNKAKSIIVTLEGEAENASIDFDLVANYHDDNCNEFTYTSNDPRIKIGKPKD